jgi:hypothetical protein
MLHDKSAFNLLAETFVPAIVTQMRRTFSAPWLEEQLHDSVVDALINYWQRPAQYKPEMRKSLYSYLLMSAQGDFKNLYQRESKRAKRLDPIDGVENWDGDAEYDLGERHFPDGFDLESFVMDGESPVWKKIAMIFADERDACCAYYILADVRETDVYVAIYGLNDLSPKDQDHVVKKHKDRIKKRLARNLDPEEFRNHD